MNINRLLQTGELIAAAAVVVSVIFVGLQLRQSNSAQVQSTTQAAVSDYISSLERLTENPDFACIYIKGVQDYQALSGSERLRFSAFYMPTYYQLQEMHKLSEEGAINADTWSGFHSLLVETTQYPGMRQWFDSRRGWFSVCFQDYLDGLIAENPVIETYLFDDSVVPECL